MMGEDVEPIAEPDPPDNRFKDPEWSTNPYFDFWKQAYLVTTNWAEDVLQQTEGLDERTRQKADFYFRQLSSAFSPSNFPMTNPEVVRETLATNGQQPRPRHGPSRQRHGEVGRSSEDQPDRHRGLRGRQESRRDPRQDRLPERPLPAHPVRPDHRQGARGAASRRSAVDQQILHPRSHADEELPEVRGRSGLHGVRRLLGEPRRTARRTSPSRTT